MPAAPASPDATSYAWTGSSGANWAAASSWSNGADIPGALTPISITGPTGPAYLVIAGNGAAASLATTGNVSLTGSHALSGALAIGGVALASAVTYLPAALALASGAAMQAGSVAVADGTLAVAAGANLATAAISLGSVAGVAYTVAGAPAYGAGAAGTLTLAAGATLADSGALALAQGTLALAGAQAGIGGLLTIGTPATPPTTTPYTYATPASVQVTAGGILTLATARILDGGASVSGAGARIALAGTLTASGTAMLAATAGGAAQLGGLALVAAPYGAAGALAVSIDIASSVEIGTAGGAAAGALSIDAGRTLLAAASTTIAGNVVDAGTVALAAGTLNVTGSLGGAGVVRIARGADLAVAGSVAAATTIAFLDSGGVLEVNPFYGVAATITGFQTGDSIVVDAPVTAAVWAAGTLTLTNNATIVARLALAGSYAGESFFVGPTTGAGASISLLAAAPAAAPASPDATSYAWTGSSGANWAAASSWSNGADIPGALTPISITGPTGPAYLVIAGNGAAASLATTGNVSLTGSHALSGALAIGGVALASAVTYLPAALALASGAAMQAGSVAVADGTLAVAAGANLATAAISLGSVAGVAYTVAGAPAFGAGAAGTLTLAAGATLADSGALALAQGTLALAGAQAGIGGLLTIGTPATPPTTTPYTYATPASVQVTAGGILTLATARILDGGASVSGAGARIALAGTLTASGTAMLAATAGGAAQLGGLALVAAPYGAAGALAVSIDIASSVEIGTAGGAAAGALSIDAGRTLLAAASTTIAGNVVDAGTVALAAGTLNVTGSLGGAGVVRIARGADLAVAGSVAAATTIAFLDSGGVLEVNPFYGVAATITGFQTGDSIVVDAPVTAAVWAAGTLTLTNNATIVARLALAGSYAGESFFVGPTTGAGASISLLAAAPAAAPASPDATSYAWTGSSGANWAAASSWSNGADIPGALTPISITGPTGPAYLVIAGNGAAASLATTGNVSLTGSHALSGALAIGGVALASAVTYLPAALALASGAAMQAGSVAVADGTLAVAAGASLAAAAISLGSVAGVAYTVAGAPAFGAGAAGTLTLAAGATLADSGALALAQGTLALAGAQAGIGGLLTIGTPATPPTTTPYTYATPASVQVTAGGILTLATARILDGGASVSGAGARIALAGTLTASGTAMLAATAGGAAQLGGLALVAAPYGAAGPLAVSIDGTSSVEIGTAGGAAAGALSIDANRTLLAAASATIAGNVIDAGTIAVAAGTLSVTGSLGGAGVVRIARGADLAVAGSVAAATTIAFLDTGGVLEVNPFYGVAATITGFQTGDSIVVPQAVGGVIYTAGSAGAPGTLSLLESGGPATTLLLAEDYAGQTFFESPTTGNGASISLLAGAQAGLASVDALDAIQIAASPSATAVVVADTAAAVQASLDALEGVAQGGKLVGISLIDAGPTTLTITATQLAADSAALAKLSGGSRLDVTSVAAGAAAQVAGAPNVASVAVSDTAAAVAANLGSLAALATTGQLASVALTDPGVPTLDLAGVPLSSALAVLARTSGSIAASGIAAAGAASVAALGGVASVAVSDSATAVAASLDALQAIAAAGKLGPVNLTDAGSPLLAVTAAQLTADASVLSRIAGGFALGVSGATAAAAATIAGTPHVRLVAVTDKAASVAADLDSLESLAGAGSLDAISLTDAGTPVLGITSAQITSDAGALAVLAAGGHPFGLDVADTPAEQATHIAAAPGVASVWVSDTAADVLADLDALEKLATAGLLGAVTLTDAGTPTLALDAARFAADRDALARIGASGGVAVLGALASAAVGLAADGLVSSVSVSDSASAIAASLDALQAVAAAGKLAGVAVAVGGTDAITVDAGQLARDGEALALLTGGASLDVAGIGADAALAAGAFADIGSLAVVDTAASVHANLDGLEALARSGRLGTVTLTDPSRPALALTAGQFAADADALARIATPFDVCVTVAGEADAAPVVLGAGANTVVAASASAAITTGPGGSLVFLGAGTASVGLLGTDTVVGGAGAATVTAPASNALVFALGGSLDFYGGSGASTVLAGTAGASIAGGAGPTLVFSDGRTQYRNGGGVDTVVGLNGSLSVEAGAGGGVFFGGTAGGNQIAVGSGNATAFGGGTGDVLAATGQGAGLFAGGAGAETLTGAGSAGANTFFAGSGNESLVGGAGATALVAGPALDTLAGGSGLMLFLFVLGRTGGADTITGWDASHDFVRLAGYAGTTGDTLAHATLANGSTSIALSDGTRVTFAGVSHLALSSFA